MSVGTDEIDREIEQVAGPVRASAADSRTKEASQGRSRVEYSSDEEVGSSSDTESGDQIPEISVDDPEIHGKAKGDPKGNITSKSSDSEEEGARQSPSNPGKMAQGGEDEVVAIYGEKKLYNTTAPTVSDSDLQDVDLYLDDETGGDVDTPRDHPDPSLSATKQKGNTPELTVYPDVYNPFAADKVQQAPIRPEESPDIEAEKDLKVPPPPEYDWPPHSNLKNPFLRTWLWFFLLIVPNLFLVSVVVIPLGDPSLLFDRHGSWPMLFFVNPLMMSVIGSVHFATYITCVGGKHSSLSYAQILLGIYFMQILALVPLVHFFGFFKFIGVISLGLTYLVTFGSVWLHQQELIAGAGARRFQHLYWRYIRIVITLFVHLSFIVVYIWAFQASPGPVQPVLSFALGIVTFINRKIVLGFSDPFPIELAMLVSGFFVNNMSDMFQTLAYPNVKSPEFYIYVWVLNLLADAANLIFLTQPWFTFRVWIKGVLLCQWRHMPKQNDDDIPDERGHSSNRPGYMRRQARFYFWRIASKLCAHVFYLFISIVLRYGPNKQYYIFSEEPYRHPVDEDGEPSNTLSTRGYMNSSVYVLFSIVFILLAAALGYILVRCRYRETYRQLKPVFKRTMVNRTFIAFIVAIAVHNGLLAITILQYHEKLWWAYQ